MENESRTALVSLHQLRQMNPDESYEEGLRQLCAKRHHPAAVVEAEDVLFHCYFPVQGASLTSTTDVGGFGLYFLMTERAAEIWGQYPPPCGSSRKFMVVMLLFVPNCELETTAGCRMIPTPMSS